MDLEDRDPHNLSTSLQVSWEEVIGEPPALRSPECAWSCSKECFNYSKNCCYIGLSVICAPLTAFCCGITLACLSFEHIWCCTPCLRVWRISCSVVQHFITAMTAAVVIPISRACGYFCSEIRIHRYNPINDDVKSIA